MKQERNRQLCSLTNNKVICIERDMLNSYTTLISKISATSHALYYCDQYCSPTMDVLKLIFISFFFLQSPLNLWYLVTGQGTCLDMVCQKNEPVIRFPFWPQGRQSSPCGYPSFNVSCGSQTMLHLPYAGEFGIQLIDYATQEVWVNDPDNCLPKRLLSLNLSASPFSGVYLEDFTFFNCTLEHLKYNYNPIACLSSPNYTVFATSSPRAIHDLSSVCSLITTVTVPVQWPFYESILSTDLSDDLRLSWDNPSCGRCEARGGRCGFKSNSSLETACFNVPQNGFKRSARYAITIGVGVPTVLCLLGLMCCIFGRLRKRLGRRRGGDQVADFTSIMSNQLTAVVVSGLDGQTIESYPKTVLGESRRLPNPDYNICSICLSEYEAKETIKTIPECQHCFHAECIDSWLKLNATCPICRNYQNKSPQTDPS